MTHTPIDPAFDARVRASFARQGIMAHLGARLLRVAPGICEIELPYRPELGQQDGFFHAGVLTTIADSAGGYAAFSLMPATARVLTVELKINLLAPAAGERAIARGMVQKAGRTLSVVQSEVRVVQAAAERPVALMLATMIAVPADDRS
jgi:uncharacterized protein (TIGR00369 family)